MIRFFKNNICRNCKYSKKRIGEKDYYECSKLWDIYPEYVLRTKDSDGKLVVPGKFSCKYFEKK